MVSARRAEESSTSQSKEDIDGEERGKNGFRQERVRHYNLNTCLLCSVLVLSNLVVKRSSPRLKELAERIAESSSTSKPKEDIEREKRGEVVYRGDPSLLRARKRLSTDLMIYENVEHMCAAQTEIEELLTGANHEVLRFQSLLDDVHKDDDIRRLESRPMTESQRSCHFIYKHELEQAIERKEDLEYELTDVTNKLTSFLNDSSHSSKTIDEQG